MTRKRWYIYALRDPITWERRYVGKTGNPKSRYQAHVYGTHAQNTHVGHWCAALRARGLRPMFEILDVGRGDAHQSAERAWIRELRKRGVRLTNIMEGGNGPGPWGRPPTPEARQRMSDAQRGRTLSPECRARISASKTGKPQRRYAVEIRRLKLLGHPVSPETREKIAASKRGKPRTPETVAKVSAARKGQRPSEETRAKLRVAQQQRRAREAALRT